MSEDKDTIDLRQILYFGNERIRFELNNQLWRCIYTTKTLLCEKNSDWNKKDIRSCDNISPRSYLRTL